MPWHAIEALDDARGATESLLRPFDRGTWLRLALIAFFVGGAGAPSFQGNPSGVGDGGDVTVPGAPGDVVIEQLPDLLFVVAAIVGVVLLLALLHGAIAAVMEFVLVRGVSERDVRIRAPFRERLGSGLRLFAFRFVVGFLWLLVIGVPIALVVLGAMQVGPAVALLVIPLVFVVAVGGLLTAVVMRLTTDFVVPAMYEEGLGVIAGWRRVWPLVRREWKQLGVYLLVRFGLSIVVGIAVAIVLGLLALIVAIPFVVVGGVLVFGLLSASGGTIGLGGGILIGVLALLFALVILILGLLVQVPVVTFFRYYSLYVLGRVDETLDLVGVATASEESSADTGAESG